MSGHPEPLVCLLRPVTGLPNGIWRRRSHPCAAVPIPSVAGGVPFPVAGDPNIIRARGRRHDLLRRRLLNNNNIGGGGIIVHREPYVKAEAHSAVPKRCRRKTGKEAGAKKNFCVHWEMEDLKCRHYDGNCRFKVPLLDNKDSMNNAFCKPGPYGGPRELAPASKRG